MSEPPRKGKRNRQRANVRCADRSTASPLGLAPAGRLAVVARSTQRELKIQKRERGRMYTRTSVRFFAACRGDFDPFRYAL